MNPELLHAVKDRPITSYMPVPRVRAPPQPGEECKAIQAREGATVSGPKQIRAGGHDQDSQGAPYDGQWKHDQAQEPPGRQQQREEARGWQLPPRIVADLGALQKDVAGVMQKHGHSPRPSEAAAR